MKAWLYEAQMKVKELSSGWRTPARLDIGERWMEGECTTGLYCHCNRSSIFR